MLSPTKSNFLLLLKFSVVMKKKKNPKNKREASIEFFFLPLCYAFFSLSTITNVSYQEYKICKILLLFFFFSKLKLKITKKQKKILMKTKNI